MTSDDAEAPPSLMTVDEAAELVAVQPKTVRGWVSAGKLPALRLGTGPMARLRLSVDAVAEFLAGRPS